MRVILLFLLFIPGVIFAEFVTELAITPGISVSEIKSDDFVAGIDIMAGMSVQNIFARDLLVDVFISPASSKSVIPEPGIYCFSLIFTLIYYRRFV